MMTTSELQSYLASLSSQWQQDVYVPRRFVAASSAGGFEPDLAFQFRGVSRDREPLVAELLQHPRVMVLGEPGSGKSFVAKAAVRALIAAGDRVPVFAELKGYRGASGLRSLLKTTPAELLDLNAGIGDEKLRRAYVLDGADEVPKEDLKTFAAELDSLLADDKDASILLTARQAFYVANRTSFPSFPAIFHVLDFSDGDIRAYVEQSRTGYDKFMTSVKEVDAEEDIRNPFVLRVMLELFRETGHLLKSRSENVSFIVERLIQRRPNQHKQRRALCMLAIAMETYCRNELTDSEALEIIKQAMPITEPDALQLLGELYGSILRHTTTGYAFQMRSYGEYLAAEALEDDRVDKVRQLAFIDDNTPNESWMNCISYLAELNADVRKLFVKRYPLWMLSSSPVMFSDDEKNQIVDGVLATVAAEGQYIYGRPGVAVNRLGRFLTPATEEKLLKDLNSTEAPVRANSILLLSWGHHLDLRDEALAIVKDRALPDSLRLCGIFALINSGDSSLVPDLMGLLDKTDGIYTNILDAIGALSDESQLTTVLPLVLAAESTLSNAFYHFHELRSREALLQILRYFVTDTRELTTIRSDGYVEPVIELLPQYFDREVAETCAAIIAGIDAHNLYLSQTGIGLQLFRLVSQVDRQGLCARLYLERIVEDVEGRAKRFYFSDQLVASLMKPKTAEWLIERHAAKTIQELSPYLSPEIRDILRAHSDGWIDKIEENTKTYELQRAVEQQSRDYQISLQQQSLLTETAFSSALSLFQQLTKSHWPELPDPYQHWLANETSNLMNKLDLENSCSWVGDAVSYPPVLPLLVKLIERYELKVEPDVPMVYCTTIWYEEQIAGYYRRYGFSTEARDKFTQLIASPKSSQALRGAISFVRAAEIWSPAIATALEGVVLGNTEPSSQAEALRLLATHGVNVEFLDRVNKNGASEELRATAFSELVARQHRSTIERALSQLLTDDNALKAGERYPSFDMPHGWIRKIRSDVYFGKLAKLREKALSLELQGEVALITEALAQIDRTKTAQLIKCQIPRAPEGWKRAQQYIFIEQERLARIEKVQKAPFEVVLKKLRGSTTLRKLKLVCEGPTDIPVFKEFLSQIPGVPEIETDSVGGWPNLEVKDERYFQQGCNESFVVMDGDEGRHLKKGEKPFTDKANKQQKKLAGLPVQFRILQRYGIENYFSRKALEKITGKDLSLYFPIPDHESAMKTLRQDEPNWKHRVRRFLSMLGLHLKLLGPVPYSKNRNGDVAKQMCLETDLKGTDLFEIIHEISNRAKELAE